MRKVGFWIGGALALLALSVFAAQLMAWLAGSGMLALGTLWARLHANSLVGLQALIEKSLGPGFWSPVLQLLLAPAWLVLAIPAALLLLLCRPRRRGFD